MKGRTVTIKTKLGRGDRKKLRAIVHKRNQLGSKLRRAQVLLRLSEGVGPSRVGELVGMSDNGVAKIRKRYLEHGLECALEGKPIPRRGSPYTDAQRQKVVAIACSEPPEGVSHWNCRLIAEQAISAGVFDTIGRESIRIILESHELKPWREKNVVRTKAR